MNIDLVFRFSPDTVTNHKTEKVATHLWSEANKQNGIGKSLTRISYALKRGEREKMT